jgi:hypothetical protein
MANMKMEVSSIEKRLDNIEAQIALIVNAMKKKKSGGLELGLEEMRKGKVHKYKSVKALVNDVWG